MLNSFQFKLRKLMYPFRKISQRFHQLPHWLALRWGVRVTYVVCSKDDVILATQKASIAIKAFLSLSNEQFPKIFRVKVDRSGQVDQYQFAQVGRTLSAKARVKSNLITEHYKLVEGDPVLWAEFDRQSHQRDIELANRLAVEFPFSNVSFTQKHEDTSVSKEKNVDTVAANIQPLICVPRRQNRVSNRSKTS